MSRPTSPQHDRHHDDVVAAEFEAFAAWVGDKLPYSIAYKREHGQWFALAVDFDVTGRGDTLVAALDELFELVLCYLMAYYRQGLPVEAAVRRIPLRLHLLIIGSSLLGALMRLAHRPQTMGQSKLLAPSSAIEHVLC